MKYDDSLKSKRMAATRDAVAGGTMELLAANGEVLASFKLSETGGRVSGDEWTLTFASNAVIASKGDNTRVAFARVKSSSGAVRISDMTAGRSNADVTLTSEHITAGQDVIAVGVKFVHAP